MVKKKIVTPPKKEEYSKKSYDNLSKTLLQYMSGRRYEPMGQTALLDRLQIPPQLFPLCKKIIADLLASGVLELKKKQLSLKQEKLETLTGNLRMHPRGFGFVEIEGHNPYATDIFIPKHLADSAVDGDKVEVVVNPDSNWEKGPDGRVVSVLKRGRTRLGGIIREVSQSGLLMAYAPLLGASKAVICTNPQELPVKIGERIIIKIEKWGDEDEPTKGEILHSIGHILDPSCDVPAAIEEFDLPNSFEARAIDEAKAYGKTVSKKDLKGRLDLTETTTFTIDPTTAKDFDDALNLSQDKKGIFHLGVHIADVAHYVKPGSHLDAEAKKRCNSTYFPNFCLPMLPEELSNNLCSLKANVIRLTATVLMDFDKEGNLLKYEIHRAYIKSAKRFTYEEAKEVLDGKVKSPHKKTLQLMETLCHILKQKRRARGSIDFSLPETVIEIDAKGNPIGLKTIEYDVTHQLVEEFMLKANEVVAKHLSDLGKALIFRIHEEPAPDNLEDFYALARSLGFTLPQKPDSQDLQQLFEQAKKTPFGQQLSVGFIRSLRLAYYSPDNVGHFGLSLEHYCHFTSPIRRYSDLIIQRILFDKDILAEELSKTALKCSEQERISFKAEMSVKTLKKLRLLKKMVDEDPALEFTAAVTKIKPFGLHFEALPVMLEGFIHISELEDDYFLYDEKRGILKGKYTGLTHKVGETLKVRPKIIDFILQEVQWELICKRKRPARGRR